MMYKTQGVYANAYIGKSVQVVPIVQGKRDRIV